MIRPAGSSPLGLDFALAAALAAVALALWLGSHSLGYVHGNDAYDYAQMGREIAVGNGFATRQIFPRHVPYYAKHGLLEADTWPNLHRYPLPTIVDAMGFLAVGEPLRGAIAMNGVAYVLSVPVLFGLARRFTGSTLAFALGLFFAADAPVRLSSYNGYTEALAMLLTLGALALVFRERLGLGACLAAGALCGLAVLNRYQSALLLPLLLGFVWFRSPKPARMSHAATLIGATLLVMLPWALRDVAVVGQPFFSLSSTRSLLKGFGWDADMRLSIPVDLPSVLSRFGGAIANKCVGCLQDKVTSVAEWTKMFRGSLYVGFLIFAAASLAWRSRERGDADLLKWGVVLFVVANVALQCVSVDHSRLYVPLRPLLLLVAAVGLVQLAELLARSRGTSVWQGVVAAGLTVVALYDIAYGSFSIHRPEWGDQQAMSIENTTQSWCPFLDPDAIVVSDVSVRVSMYCGNRTVRLPTSPADLMVIDQKYLTVDNLLFSPSAVEGKRRAGRRVPKAYVASGFLRSEEFLARFEPVPGFSGPGALYRHR